MLQTSVLTSTNLYSGAILTKKMKIENADDFYLRRNANQSSSWPN